MKQNDKNDIVKSMVRSLGDLAGVFEFDGETSYFYLYDVNAKESQKITDTIHIISGEPDFCDEDIAVRWNSDESIVGLFVRSQLLAAFDTKHNTKHGGNYLSHILPQISPIVAKSFN